MKILQISINTLTAAKQMKSVLLTHKRAFSVAVKDVLPQLNIDMVSDPVPGVFDGESWKASGEVVESINPSTGEVMARVQLGNKTDIERCIKNANLAKKSWAALPAPKRGDIVRQIGDALREKLTPLGHLLSLEMGKIAAEGIGEVQEYVDICEYAVGLSRTLQGQYLPSERSEHSLIEVYNPLGAVGIITAFNFPCAVAGWNTAISLVCGNTQIVKGSETSCLVNIATQKIVTSVLESNNIDPRVATLCQGTGLEVGEPLINSKDVNLVSFTGSTAVGRHVQETVGNRFGQTLLELGGNNAVIISENVDKDLLQNALRSILFAAVGTCGQRCTSLRRLLVHEKKYDEVKASLEKLYENVNDMSSKGLTKIGDPTDSHVLVGPLHSKNQVNTFVRKIEEIAQQGGKILAGGSIVSSDLLPDRLQKGNFVHPALVEITHDKPIVFEENFMPILHMMKITSLDEAITLNNSVDQGLSSALFTNSMQDVFKWIGPNGSDTGIINVNTGCSGAEIGGAFGGNKHTGGGRESGSDAWKQYMRRGTCTINFGNELPLAQGVDFS